jgi:hypothetical protein
MIFAYSNLDSQSVAFGMMDLKKNTILSPSNNLKHFWQE